MSCLVIFVIVQMNNQSQGDRPSRKSARQRVPNAFYTQAINELKKAPKPYRQPTSKSQSKKPRIYHESQVNSEVQDQLEDENSGITNQKNWYPCKLPKNGQLLKVQFILNASQQSVNEKKKEEAPKNTKKAESAFDLLSLFQKAIENVNDEEIEKPVESQPVAKPPPPKPSKVARPTRKQDSEGSLLAVDYKPNHLVLLHSVLGEVYFQLKDHELMTQEFDQGLVDQLQIKLLNSKVVSQLQLFQAQD